MAISPKSAKAYLAKHKKASKAARKLVPKDTQKRAKALSRRIRIIDQVCRLARLRAARKGIELTSLNNDCLPGILPRIRSLIAAQEEINILTDNGQIPLEEVLTLLREIIAADKER